MLNRSSVSTVAALLAFATAASAQVGNFYTFAQTTGTYTPVTGGTVIATATTSQTLDDVTFPVTLPFTFTYDNAPQTQIQVQTNGHICFGTVNTTTYTPLSDATVAPGYIAASGRDLQGGYVFASTRAIGSNQMTAISAVGPLQVGDSLVGTGIPTGTTVLAIAGNVVTMSANATSAATLATTQAYGPWSDIRTELQGTSPNQVFVVQWSNFRRFSTSLTVNNGTFLNFQIRLSENGQIDVVYGNCSAGVAGVTSTALHQVGLRGPTNVFPANVNNRLNAKGVSDWATSTAGTANSSGELFNTVAPANVIPNGLTYTWTPVVGTIATNTTIGTGCVSAPDVSSYELFASSAVFDLSNTAMSWIKSGTGYLAIPGVTTYVAPSGTAQVLVLTDDSEATVNLSQAMPVGSSDSTTTLTVCSNGFISAGTGNGTGFSPTAATFLAGSRPWWSVGWHDMNPAIVGSGQVKFEQIGNIAYVTWDGVWNFSGTSAADANTMQAQFDVTTGTVHIVYQTMSALGNGVLVGFSDAGASADPGSMDISAALPATYSLATFAILPLTLTATNRPVQGPGPTSWDLLVSNVPASTVIGVDIIGLSDPGIPDLGLFGLAKPGCQLHASLDVINAWFSLGFTHNYSIAIPPTPTLNGFVLFTQSACLGNGLMSDNITSNAIQGSLGNL